MTSIFISYSSRDVKIAESIQEYLEHDGVNVWRDKSRIETDWSKGNRLRTIQARCCTRIMVRRFIQFPMGQE